MANTERLYKIEALIRQRGSVSFQTLLDALEVSRATLKRDLEYLRSRLGAPIEYDRDLNGYRFGDDAGGAHAGPRHELPGLWFNERELYSLLMAHQLLSGLDSDGPLSRHLQPLLERMHQMLASSDDPAAAEALMKRVKIISALRRPVPSQFFERVGEAVLKRRRLRLVYLSRGRGEVGEREVSPQRLVHYRNTWYLDAWCHQSEGFRRFALDAMEGAALLPDKAKTVSTKQLAAELDQGYGIFAGGEAKQASLLFSAEAAQWVSKEEWHPAQHSDWQAEGRWHLSVPYVDSTELLMDLLRHAGQVEVLAPPELRAAFEQRLLVAVAQL